MARLPEQRLYDWFHRKVGHMVHMTRIENRVSRDTPDLFVAYPEWQGWIEFKVLSKFPIRPTTPIRIPGWTTGQRYWAQRQIAAGGRVALMIEVDGAIVLWRGNTAPDEWTLDEWRRKAIWFGSRNASTIEVLDKLSAI